MRRLDDIHTGIGWFVHRRLLDIDRATDFADVLSYLTSPQTYRYFTSERHWSTKCFTSWLRATIDSNLTSPP